MFPWMKWKYLDCPNQSKPFSSQMSTSCSISTMDIFSTNLPGDKSIHNIRIEIVLVAQYCHYYESFEFQQDRQITLSMIALDWECSIDHNSIALQFSHKTSIPNFFSSYFPFLRFVHSLPFMHSTFYVWFNGELQSSIGMSVHLLVC